MLAPPNAEMDASNLVHFSRDDGNLHQLEIHHSLGTESRRSTLFVIAHPYGPLGKTTQYLLLHAKLEQKYAVLDKKLDG